MKKLAQKNAGRGVKAMHCGCYLRQGIWVAILYGLHTIRIVNIW